MGGLRFIHPALFPSLDVVGAVTSSLLHFDGTHLSTTLTDESGKTWTRYGNNSLVSAYYFRVQKDAHYGSIFFDGVGDYISTPAHTDFNVGSGDFTIEFWVRFFALGGQHLCGQSDAAGTPSTVGPYIYLSGGGNLVGAIYSGSTNYVATHTTAISTNRWYHVALIRNGNNLYTAVDGVLSSPTSVTGLSSNTSTYPFSIGTLGNYTSTPANACMDEFRFTKGLACWTANFTPQWYPYGETSGLDDSYTKALLHGTAYHGSTTIFDDSGKVWTAVGNACISTNMYRVQKDLALGGLYFDGTGDYVYTPNHTDFDFGSGDFTIDFWVRFNSITAGVPQVLTGKRSSSAVYAPFIIYLYNGDLIAASSHDGTTYGVNISAAHSFATNTWYHIAFVRTGNDHKLFKNGTQIGSTATLSGAVTTNTHNVNVGADADNYSVNGWMDEVRISKGIARWTTTFTPQWHPYGTSSGLDDSYTKMLLHCTGPNSGTLVFDESGKVWNTWGSGVISTAQSKFSPSSLYLPGGGASVLYMPHHDDFNLGAGDFTIDLWVRLSALSGYHSFVNHGNTGSTVEAGSWDFGINYSGGVQTLSLYWYNGTWQQVGVTPSAALSLNTWYHLAVTRSGTTVRIFVDGVLQVTGTCSYTLNTTSASTNYCNVGAYASANYGVNGDLDEVRLSKGIARWTAGFTPATLPY